MNSNAWRPYFLALLAACAACSGNSGDDTGRTSTAQSEALVAAKKGNDGDQHQRRTALQLDVPRRFDLSHVEAPHFAVALGKDPVRIFEYVRDRIAYEPYQGSLRGPRGTLMAMAGNSVDRAVLLGALLQESGFRVHYIRGTLPNELAERLVNSIWMQGSPRGEAGSDQADPGVQAVGDQIIAAIQRDSALLHDSLKAAGLPARAHSPVTMESLLGEVRDHYWIEYWIDGKWAAMDPSFPDAVPGQAFAHPTETLDGLPESLFHRIEIRVLADEYLGNSASIREVLRYSAKAADLSGVDLLLVHAPTDPKHQGSSRVTPTFIVKEKRIEGAPFWLEPPRENAAGGLSDALGGGGDEIEVALASAEFIEMNFIAPDGRKESVVRQLFDHVGKHRRMKGEALDASSALALSAEIDPDVYVATTYDLFVTTGAIDEEHVTNLPPPPPLSDLDRIDVGAGLKRMNIAFSAASDALTRRIAGPGRPVSRTYLESPRVQIAELAATADRVRIGLDLRRDVARTVVQGFKPEHSFGAQVVRGIVDATLERFVVDHFGRLNDGTAWATGPVVSTSWLFERAQAASTPALTMTRDSPGHDVPLRDNTRAWVNESLAAGQVIVAPRRPVAIAGTSRYAWWEVDPRTGETVAVTDEGLRGSVIELSIVATPYGIYIVIYLPQTRHVVTQVTVNSPAAAEMFCTMLTARLSGVANVFWGWVG